MEYSIVPNFWKEKHLFFLEATVLILTPVYVPGASLCALHIPILLVLIKTSGSQCKAILPTPLAHPEDIWQYLVTFLLVTTGGLLLASSRQ